VSSPRVVNPFKQVCHIIEEDQVLEQLSEAGLVQLARLQQNGLFF
jgi:hypothetical protein